MMSDGVHATGHGLQTADQTAEGAEGAEMNHHHQFQENRS